MKGWAELALVLGVALVATGHLGWSVDGQVSQLSATFYANSCANVDTIVRSVMVAAMNQSAIVGPSVLRLFAHDCLVGGCDGSILLQDTPGSPPVERDAPDNLSLQQLSFDTINQVKQAVEAQCPGVVSCSDILSMAVKDAVNSMGGPSWTVLLGRRDGVNSSEAATVGRLPGSDMNVSQLGGIFSTIGLSTKDLVTLSGAHTVGFAHCKEFDDRLYDFNNVSGASDPSLAANYVPTLTALCPNGNFSNTTVQALDLSTPGQFDNSYYQELQIGQGLLFSDQVLFVDNATTNLVTTYANNQAQFFADFVTSMIAMSQIAVLTGTQGEIRANCSVVNNSPSSNSSTTPVATPVVPVAPSPTTPVVPVTPSPTTPVVPVTPSPTTPVVPVTPSPTTPVVPVTPSPAAPVVVPVTPSPPAPVVPVTPSPPPPVVPVMLSPPPPVVPVIPSSPPPVVPVTPSSPPPVVPVTPSSPPPVAPVTPSPLPPVVPVTPSPPPPVVIVTPSPPPPPPVVTVSPSPRPPVAHVTPPPKEPAVPIPPPPRTPGNSGRRRRFQ